MATISLSSSCAASGSPAQLLAAIDNIYGITASSSTDTNVRAARSKSSSYPSSTSASGRISNAPGKKFLASCSALGSVQLVPVEIFAPSAIVATNGGTFEIDVFVDSVHGASAPFSSIILFRIGASKLIALASSIVARNTLFSIFPTKIYSSSIAPQGSLLASKIRTLSINLSSSILAAGTSAHSIKQLSLFEQFVLFFHRRHHRS